MFFECNKILQWNLQNIVDSESSSVSTENLAITTIAELSNFA